VPETGPRPIAEGADEGASASPANSPTADDFSDLLEESTPGRNPPYRDDFEDLLPE
jgi:hypothetical protein